jgi:hypothetical protein
LDFVCVCGFESKKAVLAAAGLVLQQHTGSCCSMVQVIKHDGSVGIGKFGAVCSTMCES